jgi:hypothetical protein
MGDQCTGVPPTSTSRTHITLEYALRRVYIEWSSTIEYIHDDTSLYGEAAIDSRYIGIGSEQWEDARITTTPIRVVQMSTIAHLTPTGVSRRPRCPIGTMPTSTRYQPGAPIHLAIRPLTG